jgi:hypothetical protein
VQEWRLNLLKEIDTPHAKLQDAIERPSLTALVHITAHGFKSFTKNCVPYVYANVVLSNTVKASNFAPPGNSELFFSQKGLLRSKRFLQKSKRV